MRKNLFLNLDFYSWRKNLFYWKILPMMIPVCVIMCILWARILHLIRITFKIPFFFLLNATFHSYSQFIDQFSIGSEHQVLRGNIVYIWILFTYDNSLVSYIVNVNVDTPFFHYNLPIQTYIWRNEFMLLVGVIPNICWNHILCSIQKWYKLWNNENLQMNYHLELRNRNNSVDSDTFWNVQDFYIQVIWRKKNYKWIQNAQYILKNELYIAYFTVNGCYD